MKGKVCHWKMKKLTQEQPGERERRERIYRGSCGQWALLHTAQLQGALCPQSSLPPLKMKKEMNRGGKGSGRLELLCRHMRLSTEGDR